MNHIAPDYMCSKFMLAKNSHSHRTRGATKNRITLPMVNTGFGQNTFSSRTAKVWNVLPDHMTWIEACLLSGLLFPLYQGRRYREAGGRGGTGPPLFFYDFFFFLAIKDHCYDSLSDVNC